MGLLRFELEPETDRAELGIGKEGKDWEVEVVRGEVVEVLVDLERDEEVWDEVDKIEGWFGLVDDDDDDDGLGKEWRGVLEDLEIWLMNGIFNKFRTPLSHSNLSTNPARTWK